MTQAHKHTVVSPGGTSFHCLSCGKQLTPGEANAALVENDEQEVIRLLVGVGRYVEEIMSGPAYPINDEYCWTHEGEGPGLGGWTCQHPDCRAQQEGEHEQGT